jgi:hypothetical protein
LIEGGVSRRHCVDAGYLDAEAAVSGAEGIAVFDALHRRRAAPDAILHAFDLLELNGKELRSLPLGEHKAKLGAPAVVDTNPSEPILVRGRCAACGSFCFGEIDASFNRGKPDCAPMLERQFRHHPAASCRKFV